MKRLFSFIGAAMMVIAVTSCGGGGSKSSKKQDNVTEEKQEVSITPETVKIAGLLGNAYRVVDRNYKIKGDFPKLNVDIELVDPSQLPPGFDPQTVGTRSNKGNAAYPMLVNFTVEFLDEDGDVVRSEDGSDIEKVIRLAQGDKAAVTFYAPHDYKNITQFRVISDYYPNEIKKEEVVEEITEKVKTTTSDEDFEELEKVMDHASKAMETTTKMMKNVLELTK